MKRALPAERQSVRIDRRCGGAASVRSVTLERQLLGESSDRSGATSSLSPPSLRFPRSGRSSSLPLLGATRGSDKKGIDIVLHLSANLMANAGIELKSRIQTFDPIEAFRFLPTCHG